MTVNADAGLIVEQQNLVDALADVQGPCSVKVVVNVQKKAPQRNNRLNSANLIDSDAQFVELLKRIERTGGPLALIFLAEGEKGGKVSQFIK